MMVEFEDAIKYRVALSNCVCENEGLHHVSLSPVAHIEMTDTTTAIATAAPKPSIDTSRVDKQELDSDLSSGGG
eukprot:CAMPEP_0195581850 /NCGR_PEP_ID=MMETSP0814-20130614/21087_1 /TAXON_ID=97485 /ORGANISM="Prymnesium parvum, Strain Texoma1" /LENGTH=73 /DNA_ID=CAMNT_0040719311 /DNA_START=61 /DNA_END=282 /DNA_ORIENTATION=-